MPSASLAAGLQMEAGGEVYSVLLKLENRTHWNILFLFGCLASRAIP